MELFLANQGIQSFIEQHTQIIQSIESSVWQGRRNRDSYLNRVYERDCDDIRRACKGLGVDKSAIVEIINNRTQYQLNGIDKVYRDKFKMSLAEQVDSELKSATGFLTGSLSDLGEFISNRTAVPAERDAKIIRGCCTGMSTDDDLLIEMLCTRTVAQLTDIKAAYAVLYKKDIISDISDAIRFPNYKDLALKVLKCERVENEDSAPDDLVEEYCKTIYSKLNVFISVDGKEINTLFTTVITPTVFDQCDAIYRKVNKTSLSLTAHIKDKTGGDYCQFLLALATSRYYALSQIMYNALNSTFANKGTINRYVLSAQYCSL